MTPAVVREWHAHHGWGVIDSSETPGGCWAGFVHVEMTGYRELTAGQRVVLEWERGDQDGFDYRAVRVTPSSDMAWHAFAPEGTEPEDAPRTPPPDGSVIRLFGEFGVSIPLWGPDGLMFNDADEVVRELGVSPDLAADLESCGDEADEAFRLVRRLNAELGHRYRFIVQET